MKTLKQSLAQLGISPPYVVPSDFQTCPSSLLEIIRILNLPEPDFAGSERRCVHSFSENMAQGLVFAHDDVWFLSSKDNIFRYSIEGSDLYHPSGVHRVARKSRSELVQEVGRDGDNYVHIGGLGYLDGVVFVPIESKGAADWLLLGIDEELHVVGYSLMPHEMSDAFVSANPWNKRLYVCRRLDSPGLCAYRASEFLEKLEAGERGTHLDPLRDTDGDIELFREDGSDDVIRGAQGVSFSKDGHIFLSWWRCTKRVEDVSPLDPLWLFVALIGDLWEECVEWANHIRVYNALTGVFLYDIEYDFAGTLDEIEGLSIHPSGVLYVAVSDHDVLDEDEFDIHAFQW